MGVGGVHNNGTQVLSQSSKGARWEKGGEMKEHNTQKQTKGDLKNTIANYFNILTVASYISEELHTAFS